MKPFRSSRPFFLLTVMGALFAARPAAAADPASTQTEALEREAASLADRMNRLDQVRQAHAQFVALRDGEMLGEHGIAAGAQAFYAQATKWLDGWNATVTALAQTKDMTSPADREALVAAVRDRGQELQDLSKMAAAISVRADNVRRAAAALPALGRNTVPNKADVTSFLDAQRDKLAESATAAANLVSTTVMSRWTQIAAIAERITNLRVQRDLSNSPELRNVLAEVAELYRAERVGGPLVASVHQIYVELDAAISAKRVFAAEGLRARLDAAANDALAAFTKEKLSESASATQKASIDYWRKRGFTLYSQTVDVLGKVGMVAGRFNDSGDDLAFRCADPKKRLEVNCELFREVFRVPISTIAQMSEAELKVLDEYMDRASRPAPPSKP